MDAKEENCFEYIQHKHSTYQKFHQTWKIKMNEYTHQSRYTLYVICIYYDDGSNIKLMQKTNTLY